ncbi:SAM-dependent methyltransferase [Maritimibacter sp. UBA3975]|uniref:SAM-dependent methyltransferase n=1 Tax=Maritimibacter sp. UBA3975 TaxID=1946833 RepID=UPI000C0B683F|nr:SAM-dependent methyltransferase [Maritimibacter sp. UBA3975]MAM62753.1 tRNA (N6-threonylcarbamoyladenosine(37)-N6)-methyltransferase TrmO [Maritimibacter sp.]|tara:strand:+ start:17795 stop:18265 length:471 start_codon:yes stop_codon:yes gene_type:complete
MTRETIHMQPIGHIRGGRVTATKDNWGRERAVIELSPEVFSPEATMGLELQSHIEVVFHFHLHADEPMETAARHPRGREDWPRVGILAQRGRMRPNRIGVSICRLDRVEGLALHVIGLDAVDGTPVLDVKPVWSGYRPRGALREPDWAVEIMASYW